MRRSGSFDCRAQATAQGGKEIMKTGVNLYGLSGLLSEDFEGTLWRFSGRTGTGSGSST